MDCHTSPPPIRSINLFPEAISLRSRTKGAIPPTAYVVPQKVKVPQSISDNTVSSPGPPTPPPRVTSLPAFRTSATPDAGHWRTNHFSESPIPTSSNGLDAYEDYDSTNPSSSLSNPNRRRHEHATKLQLSQHQVQIDFLQEKLKELENQLIDKRMSSWKRDERPYSSSDLLYQQHMSMQWKEQEINQLHAKLGKARSELDLYQRHYDTDCSRLRIEIQQRKDQLGTLKCRVSELESECMMWRDRASEMEQSLRSAPCPKDMTRSENRIKELEHDNSNLRETVDSLHKICHNLKKVATIKTRRRAQCNMDGLESVVRQLNSELEWLQIQNGALNISLEMKEHEVNELKQTKHETRVSMGPTNLDETDLDCIRDCSFVVDCLRDTITSLVHGKLPNINRLLACKSSSMESTTSASGSLVPPRDQIHALQTSLHDLQQLLSSYYANQVAENSKCNVQ